MKFLKFLTRDGNNGDGCDDCPALWTSCNYEGCDGDYGCTAGHDCDEACHLPPIVRWYKSRRNDYFDGHQYDDIEEWYRKQEEVETVAVKTLRDELARRNLCICYKAKDFNLSMDDLDYVLLREIVSKMQSAIDDVRDKDKPHGLRAEWADLIKRTWKRFVFHAKSYF